MSQFIINLQSLGIVKALRGSMLNIALLCLIAAGLVALNILKPIVFSWIIDEGLLEKDWGFVKKQCLHFGLIALGISLLTLSHGWLASVISNKISLVIKGQLLNRIFDLDIGFFQKVSTGDLHTRIDGDIERIQDYMMSVISVTMNSFLGFLSAMIYIGMVQWKMLIAGFAIVPLVALCIYGFRKAIYQSNLAARESRAKTNTNIVSSIEHIEYFRQTGLDLHVKEKIKLLVGKQHGDSVVTDRWSSLNSSAMNAITSLGYIVIIGYGSWLTLSDQLSIGHLFAFLTLRARFLAPLTFVESIYRGYYSTKSSYERLLEINEYPVERGIDCDKGISDEVRSIRFNGVSFGYEKDKLLIRDLDFDFAQLWYGICGVNGSGKSTILSIILKTLQPNSGTIEVNGVDLNDVGNRNWRKAISVMPQHTYLVDDTLRGNIKLHRAELDDAKIKETLDRLCFWTDDNIKDLEFKITDGGRNLSGGQRQKIALARTILKDAQIYIFDESLAHIDETSTPAILDYLKSELADKIVIWVSHKNIDRFVDVQLHVENYRPQNNPVLRQAVA